MKYPRVTKQRKVEKAGVIEAHRFFSDNDCIFQEIDLGNDFGKDAYVDFSTDRNVRGWCCALQIKSGAKYKRANHYIIPIDDHLAMWRESTVPIIGIVHDKKSGDLYWINITEYLRQNREPGANIVVPKENLLTAKTLEERIKPDIAKGYDASLALTAAANVFSSNEAIQVSAVVDCIGLGFTDERPVIVLRNALTKLSHEALRAAIEGLVIYTHSYASVFWSDPIGKSPLNDIRAKMEPLFVWTEDEIELMFDATGADERAPTDVGFMAYLLIGADDSGHLTDKLHNVLAKSLDKGNSETAGFVLAILIDECGEMGSERLEELRSQHPAISDLPDYQWLRETLDEFGELFLYS